ncbi:hypothetical protein KSP40_PGU017495 [Platanthera guangdongensis]|uniref:Uncharacterized protein n=1 Tax=Platanthera guangdongensis TaxID=2320717 RepID=A0ABR2MSX9_9ASPA
MSDTPRSQKIIIADYFFIIRKSFLNLFLSSRILWTDVSATFHAEVDCGHTDLHRTGGFIPPRVGRQESISKTATLSGKTAGAGCQTATVGCRQTVVAANHQTVVAGVKCQKSNNPRSDI